jgi:hypothetical protein
MEADGALSRIDGIATEVGVIPSEASLYSSVVPLSLSPEENFKRSAR